MESGQNFRTLVEQVPAIFYRRALQEGDEPDQELLYVSPRVEDVLGYSPGDWLANPGLWEERLHPDDRERVSVEYALAKRVNEPLNIEHRLLACDGGIVWFCDEATLVRDEAGDPLYWQGVRYDVTERKRANEEAHLLRTLALEIAGAEDLDSALGITLRRVCEATGWAIGQAWVPKADGTALECSPAWHAQTDSLVGFRAANEGLVLGPGEGLPGNA